ncbi:STAS domain-containing protein [Oceanobacillus alkalisoli]|uniref:STAS domain-containing protein n=1 Tax=Oceanobacillus alkalisoli TaxID=2925113 RepID=UPI001EF13A2C|nr:STAS domain-containing protein [Oceanobacillus alkalisoli]MCF3944654.1 STAS domain-containing protein [Oceanobacillus alkalisoli]MCG5104840.1 STAS domain-containing protein [Oceanobacillus alkalisoli]
MNLEITLTEEGNQSIIALAGEIDAYTVTNLKETFDSVTKKEGQEVIVDLEHVTYMDSTGLGVFIGALKSTKESDSELKLVNIQDRVYRLFQITGLDEIMDVKAAIRGGNE